MIQYQFEGNKHLVYVLIRRRNVFYSLQNLTLSPFENNDVVSGNRLIIYWLTALTCS